MKYISCIIFIIFCCVSDNVNAMNIYNNMRSRLIDFGESIEKIDNVPLIDKLTNLLPFAMVAACLKECPGQTMIALTGLLFYVVLKKNSMRKVKYSIQQKKNQRMYDKKIKKLYVGSH